MYMYILDNASNLRACNQLLLRVLLHCSQKWDDGTFCKRGSKKMVLKWTLKWFFVSLYWS